MGGSALTAYDVIVTIEPRALQQKNRNVRPGEDQQLLVVEKPKRVAEPSRCPFLPFRLDGPCFSLGSESGLCVAFVSAAIASE